MGQRTFKRQEISMQEALGEDGGRTQSYPMYQLMGRILRTMVSQYESNPRREDGNEKRLMCRTGETLGSLGPDVISSPLSSVDEYRT